jgi:hypothetical protein
MDIQDICKDVVGKVCPICTKGHKKRSDFLRHVGLMPFSNGKYKSVICNQKSHKRSFEQWKHIIGDILDTEVPDLEEESSELPEEIESQEEEEDTSLPTPVQRRFKSEPREETYIDEKDVYERVLRPFLESQRKFLASNEYRKIRNDRIINGTN